MGELKKLKSFDNKKKKYEDRKKHVEDVLAGVELDEILTRAVCGDDYTLGKIEKSLEDLGTYLLDSQDVESERKIKHSFYRNEKYYKTSTNIGKKSFPISIQDNEYILYKNIIEESLYEEEGEDKHESLNKYIMDGINPDQLKKVINNYLKIKKIDPTGVLIINIDDKISKIKMKNLIDEDIIKLKMLGNSVKEISERLGVPSRTIRHRFDRMVNSAFN